MDSAMRTFSLIILSNLVPVLPCFCCLKHGGSVSGYMRLDILMVQNMEGVCLAT